MQRDKQLELLEKFSKYAKTNSSDMSAEGRRKPCSAYTSDDELKKELEVLFKRQPIIIGLSSQIPNPGDFITKKVLGKPLLIIRADNGQVRGFFNVCRHRAACLVREPAGSDKKSFTCPYHSWTYNTQGELTHIPHDEGFPHVNREKNGLVPIHVEEAFGMLVAVFGEASSSCISDFFGPVSEELRAAQISGHRVFKQLTVQTKSNWKQTLEQFLESYHIRYIHRNSVRKYFVDNVQSSELLGLHTRFAFPRTNIRELESQDKSAWAFRDYANANYLLFPNTLFLVQQDHLLLAPVWPDGTGQSVVDYYFLIPEDISEDKLAYFELNHQILMTTVMEDVENGNTVQEGLASGAFENVNVGRFEQGLLCFHEALESVMSLNKTEGQ